MKGRIFFGATLLGVVLLCGSADARPRRPRARKTAKHYRFDGFKLGDMFTAVMLKKVYRNPCDVDPIDKGKRRIAVYGALPCRGRTFPLKTTVVFILKNNPARRGIFNQPIEAFGFMGGQYYRSRSNFPVHPGDTLQKATKFFGRPIARMTIGRRVTLGVQRHRGSIYILSSGSRVVGAVVGFMPWSSKREQWRLFAQMYRRYTPKLVSKPDPAPEPFYPASRRGFHARKSPETSLTRADIMKAFAKILRPRGRRRYNRLKPCFAKARGKVRRVVVVRVTVRGSTGRVSKIKVVGKFAKTRVGRCVARYLKARLRFPKFTRPQVHFVFPIVSPK